MAPLDFPPPTLHVFMGSYAPINHSTGSLYQTQPTNFFQDYRNETLSRFTMPTYHWGLTRTPYSPRADLVGAYRKANWKRLLEETSVKPRIIDEARSQEVDDFYKAERHTTREAKYLPLPSPNAKAKTTEPVSLRSKKRSSLSKAGKHRAKPTQCSATSELCQMHREQYQDHTGRLHPLKYFMQTDEGWNSPKLTKVYMDFPTKYVEYKKPAVLPKTYARSVPIPYLPERNLVGRYYPGSDNLYNR